MPTKLTINNRSKFPDVYVKYICTWLFKKVDNLKFKFLTYEIDLKHTNGSWYGRGWDNYQKSYFNRYIGQEYARLKKLHSQPVRWPHKIHDFRYSHAETHIVNNRTEEFIYLIAHEMYHAISKFRKSRGEFLANDYAYKMVKEWRKEKYNVWDKIKTLLRKEVKRKKEKIRKEKEKKILKRNPATKLQLMQKHYENWQKKQKHCSNMMKKYRQKVKYYERRVAASEGSK